VKKTKNKNNQNQESNTRLLQNKLNENKLVIILFLLSTAFFIYQHSIYTSWDFNTYVLNAKYWFANGNYFEILRPPLMPLMLGFLSIFGWFAAEYIFIILVSLLFAYSSIKLAKSIRFHPAAFYALSLNVYLLHYGLINGTEILSLIFLELFIVFLIEDRYFSGLFLALSALSRYTCVVFFPLILLHLKFRQILKSLLLFAAALSIWFTYNFYTTGNFFTSFADQYANNLLYRDYIVQNIQPIHFLKAQNILIPFFILGIIIFLFKLFKLIKGKSAKSFLKIIDTFKVEIIMFFLSIISVISYNNIPIKNPRYLFNIILPTIYFAYVGLNYLVKKISIRKKTLRIIIISAAAIIIIASMLVSVEITFREHEQYSPASVYKSAINEISALNLTECSVESNAWIYLNYFGQNASPSPPMGLVSKRIEQGEVLVLFRHESEPKYIKNDSFINSLPIIYRSEDYVIIGLNNCTLQNELDSSYLEQIDKISYDLHGYHINYNPCFVLFHDSAFLEKTCNFVNFNGFVQDDYRQIE
jgi:hypothetical protein